MPFSSQSAPSAALPRPPTAEEITLPWLLANKATLAAYMQTVYALANSQVVVIYQGKTLPARAVKLASGSAVIEVFVSSS